MTGTHRQEQIAQVEEILGDRLDEVGFVKGLFFGRHLRSKLPPYPIAAEDGRTGQLVDELKQFCREHLDPAEIDRNAEIPPPVVERLGRMGVLGACLPKSCGGLELSQGSYCRLLEVLGAHCGSTSLFVNAHHSIGPRALVLFGSPEQQQKWLPKMATGQWISAFALTEPEAGSDAANVQSTATPKEDGSGYLLNGEKRWITNGGIARVLTVMAGTPIPGQKQTKITAFIVTPEMPGFEVVEKRMDKCGVRGTVTSRLAFHDMFVPRENVLGQLGGGLKIALTVLDYGRTTFGATCTGAAKFCAERAVGHAGSRFQFGQALGSFELVKQKLARIQAGVFAMEACTYQTAALMDVGECDFMLETAVLKIFATETLWRIINDTIQIHGGKAYFTDEPFERMMRDARINMIGEGANDVLRVFVALMGMRDVGLELEGVLSAIKQPIGNLTKLGWFAGRKLGSLLTPPVVEVSSPELENDAARLGKSLSSFAANVERLLRTYQREIVDRQYQLGRIADAAAALYVSSCVLNRLDAMLRVTNSDGAEVRFGLAAGRYYLNTAARRIRQSLQSLWNNDDQETTRLADGMLRPSDVGRGRPG